MADLEGFKDAWQAYYSALEFLAERLMKVFAEAFG
tara:strand:+ start:203 stop:307 length:105 start_codon:yes stop_codon:yes gene_type:complete